MAASKIDKTYLCPVLERFVEHIETHRLFKRDNQVILAVSGGIDSMVMLDLFIRAGFSVAVAHVNFGLRGAESEADESFVQDQCTRLSVPFHSKRVETNNYAIDHDLSIQVAARKLRYEWFDQLVVAGFGDIVATAHHLNDSIETTLLNLVRGSGPRGLVGIPLVNKHVVRPMMFASRGDIEHYAADRGIVWREDISNLTVNYQRNEVRHKVMPPLRALNPSLEDTWRRNIEKALGDNELVDMAISEWKRHHMTSSRGSIRLNKSGLNELTHPLSLLLRILEPFGFTYGNCRDILRAIHGQPGKVFMSTSHQLVIDRDVVVLAPSPQTFQPVKIDRGDSASELGPFRLSIDERQGNSIETDPAIAILDRDKVTFPLQWRTWKEGDYFFPLGMKGKKKVSDFLVDLKLSIPEKQEVTVIESDDEIVWLPGLRIDDRYKVTAGTRTSLVLRFRTGSR